PPRLAVRLQLPAGGEAGLQAVVGAEVDERLVDVLVGDVHEVRRLHTRAVDRPLVLVGADPDGGVEIGLRLLGRRVGLAASPAAGGRNAADDERDDEELPTHSTT